MKTHLPKSPIRNLAPGPYTRRHMYIGLWIVHQRCRHIGEGELRFFWIKSTIMFTFLNPFQWVVHIFKGWWSMWSIKVFKKFPPIWRRWRIVAKGRSGVYVNMSTPTPTWSPNNPLVSDWTVKKTLGRVLGLLSLSCQTAGEKSSCQMT